MYTSLALIALVAYPVARDRAEGPRWLNDYSQARKLAQNEKKPLAVFLATGQEGHGKVAEEGKISAEAASGSRPITSVCTWTPRAEKASAWRAPSR